MDLIAAIGLAVLAAPPPPQDGPRPNIVLIMMDDLGYGDVGSYGVPDTKTPSIDRLAREGVKLTDFYANAANCSPTRTALVTGRYQQRYGIEMPLGTFKGDLERGLAPSATSLGRLLKTRGYATALFGKWHLGWQPEFHPNRHGFDEFWGFLSGGHDYYTNLATSGRVDLYHNDQPVTLGAYLTDEISSRALSFIDRHHRQPFFLEVAYHTPHWPFQPPGLPPDRRARSHLLHDGTRADYVAMVESADRGIGEILDALDRLGLTRTTMVIFTSDNGGEWLSRNAPFFHRKSTLWEGGIRVPALVRWPDRLPAGVVSRQVGITMDLTATMLAAAGVTVPASHRPEGIDLLPLLAEGRVVERTLFWRIRNEARDQKAVRRGRLKYLRDGVGTVDGVHELIFDLDADPGERDNLSVTHAVLLEQFRKLLEAWEADVGPDSAGRP